MTFRRSSSGVAFARALVCSMLFSRVSLGQSETDKLSAQEALLEANQLRDKGDLVAALAKYKAAFAFAATPITAYELGRAEADTGHLVEAYNTLRGVERIPSRPNESQRSKDARGSAASLADRIRTRIPELSIVVHGAPPGAAPTVILDGTPVNPDTLSFPHRVNPGKHVVIAKAEGRSEGRAEVDLEERASRVATIELPPAPSASASPAPSAAPSTATGADAAAGSNASVLGAGPAAQPAVLIELGGIVGTSSGLVNSLSFIPGELLLGASFKWFEVDALGILGSVDLSKGATFGAVAGRLAARLPLNHLAFTLGGTFGYFDATTSNSISPGPWVSGSFGFESFPVCHWIIDVHVDGGIIGDTGDGKPAGRALFAFSLGYRAGACKPP
jgi:hypothetical protein